MGWLVVQGGSSSVPSSWHSPLWRMANASAPPISRSPGWSGYALQDSHSNQKLISCGRAGWRRAVERRCRWGSPIPPFPDCQFSPNYRVVDPLCAVLQQLPVAHTQAGVPQAHQSILGVEGCRHPHTPSRSSQLQQAAHRWGRQQVGAAACGGAPVARPRCSRSPAGSNPRITGPACRLPFVQA